MKLLRINDTTVKEFGGYTRLADEVKTRWLACVVDYDHLDFFKTFGNICRRIYITDIFGYYIENATLYNNNSCSIRDIVKIINAMPWIDSLNIYLVHRMIFVNGEECRTGLKHISITHDKMFDAGDFNRYISSIQHKTLVSVKGFNLACYNTIYPKLMVYDAQTVQTAIDSFPELIVYKINGNHIGPHTYDLVSHETHKSLDIDAYIHMQTNRQKGDAIKCLALCMLRIGVSKDMRKKIQQIAHDVHRDHWTRYKHISSARSNDIHWSTQWSDMWQKRENHWLNLSKSYRAFKYTESHHKLLNNELNRIEKEDNRLRIKKQKLSF